MDAAIDDGVDILSLSLGGYTNDPVALGAYSETERGILVSCSAGNNGPFNGTTSNEAPWILTVADAHVLPALDVTYADGIKILAYMNSTKKPVARITFQGTIIGDKNAPVVPGFSSRGPSTASPGILKPDIIGPGVNILAA
ncbi:hypothetical protein K7X08_029963 [Anisodus acutangulus]|uniref:Peptidase S8/S53 domain-containing protein n=1 Tax=Anisodus acutangulus TaxID=402998 RepID=A0A9Q1LNH8_9SOLA|nr:hypothetical protein K7X08_029963 [Anisodus acutangulus]